MPTMIPTRRKFVAACTPLLVGALAWIGLSSRAAPILSPSPELSQSLPAMQKGWEKFRYQDATACTQCHSFPNPANEKSWDLCTFAEWPIWRTHDKHAQAYAVLTGKRGKMIGDLMGMDVLKAETGCLNCHAMANLQGEKEGGLNLKDGVSCGGCHGPSAGAGGWLGPHTDKAWREKHADEKAKMGLRNLRDPIIRAELCMSCHIGNAQEGKVVSHAMMAAGHPPLPPIEISTFSNNEPQHWRDPKHVPFFKDAKPEVLKAFGYRNLEFYNTEMAVVGSIVAVRETFRLAGDRADFKADPKLAFPELAVKGEDSKNPADRWSEIALAHSDCFACHHDLKYPGFRQERGFMYHVPKLDLQLRVTPGRPMVRSWPLSGLSVGAAHTGKKLDNLKPILEKLTDATNIRPFGSPTGIITSSKQMVEWCDVLLDNIKNKPIDRPKALAIAKSLATLYTPTSSYTPDYETARQVGSMLLTVLVDLNVKDQDKAMETLRTQLNTEPYFNRDKRIDLVVESVRNAMEMPNDDKFKMSRDKFLKFTANINTSKTEDLKGNAFLLNMFGNAGNASFTEAFSKPPLADELQKFSDQEQEKVLKTIAAYSPEQFFAAMAKVAKLIPE